MDFGETLCTIKAKRFQASVFSIVYLIQRTFVDRPSEDPDTLDESDLCLTQVALRLVPRALSLIHWSFS
jgi:hypothetical protein